MILALFYLDLILIETETSTVIITLHYSWNLLTGVFHAADVPYIFGHPLIGLHPEVEIDSEIEVMSLIPWTDDDYEYSEYWIDLLSNFAKTG